jgi:type IV pilus assembly protein PilC
MQYRYVARTAAGERVRGSLVAADREAAVAGLHGRALFVTSVERDVLGGSGMRPRIGPSAERARVAFFRSFSTLIRAGVPMRRALQVAIERTGHDGLREHLAQRIAIVLERDAQLRKNVVAALAYPATVLVASLALVIFLIVRIVPMFEDLFASFHVELPASTRALLWLGARAGEPLPWILAVAVIIAATFGAIAARRTRGGALAFDRLRLGIPVVGPLLRLTIHARFARMLGTLVHSGVELTRALAVVTPVTASPVHQAALDRVALALREGEALTPPMAATRAFDPLLVTLVGVGEETGMLDVMLETAAASFESDVAAAVATLGAVIEPALIVALGAIVGFIVYSVYIPLYSLIGSLGK